MKFVQPFSFRQGFALSFITVRAMTLTSITALREIGTIIWPSSLEGIMNGYIGLLLIRCRNKLIFQVNTIRALHRDAGIMLLAAIWMGPILELIRAN